MAITVEKLQKWASKKKTPKLIKTLSSSDVNIRVATIKALGLIKNEDSMNALIPLLNDPLPEIRASAAEALGNVGIARSLEFIRQLWLNEENELVREKAKWAMNQIKSQVAQEELNN